MPKYKECLRRAAVTEPALFESVKAVDARVTKPLLTDFTIHRCLPTPTQLDAICGALNCTVVELYSREEINLLNDTPPAATQKRQNRDGRSHGENVYNLTVELDRAVAERTLNDESLRLLGYKDKSDFIRQTVARADARIRHLKRKTARGADTPKPGGKL